MLETLNQLNQWQLRANLEEFKYIFGVSSGTHLWEKFNTLHHDLLGLWKYLDVENKKILAEHIQSIVVSNTKEVSTKKFG